MNLNEFPTICGRDQFVVGDDVSYEVGYHALRTAPKTPQQTTGDNESGGHQAEPPLPALIHGLGAFPSRRCSKIQVAPTPKRLPISARLMHVEARKNYGNVLESGELKWQW